MKAFGNKLLATFIVFLTIMLSGCTKKFNESFSMWLVFGSSDSSHFSNPAKLEIYEESGAADFTSLTELYRKQNRLTITDSKAIEDALASLRSEYNGPLAIRKIAKTVHIVAYQETLVGYVKYSILSENSEEAGLAMPIQSETSSVLANVSFIEWLKKQKTNLGKR